jgi:hypothetical protein
MAEFELTEKHKQWARKRHQKVPASELIRLLMEQKGLCKLSQAPLVFDVSDRTPIKGGRGCHPLCPAVDHKDPCDPKSGYTGTFPHRLFACALCAPERQLTMASPAVDFARNNQPRFLNELKDLLRIPFQIVCYALNDLKGHLPGDCFDALSSSNAWKELMRKWKEKAEKEPGDREGLRRLICPNPRMKRGKMRTT